MIREHAGRYGVAPLVAFAARKYVSSADRAWCDRVLIASWTRHERMLRHLEFVLGLLADEKIPAISLKGPLLAQRYYAPAFLRKPSMDLDLAVIEQDLGRACDVLTRAGYKQDVLITEALTRGHHLVMSHPSRPKVELHFRLSHQSLGIPVHQFFERTVSCRLPNGRDAEILGSADQLLHLTLHLAHSRFGTLFHLDEIRRVCRAEPLGIRAEAIGRAVDHRFCGALRMIDLAFRVHWGERFLPPEIEVPATWLDWRLNETLYKQFELWSAPGRRFSPVMRLWGRWLDFQITDAPSDAFRIVKHLARSARFPYVRRVWATAKDLTYGPD